MNDMLTVLIRSSLACHSFQLGATRFNLVQLRSTPFNSVQLRST